MLANEEDLEKPLSSLTIKDEDKALFIKRKTYRNEKWRKAHKQGETKIINIKEVYTKQSSKSFNDRQIKKVLQFWKERTLR